MSAFSRVLADAERTLRSVAGVPPEGTPDPRWQAMVEVGEFVGSNPEEVWQFASRWGCSSDANLREAVAACLVEHLLEHHFHSVFPRVRELASRNPVFADTVRRSWSFGETWNPADLQEWRSFQESLRNDG